jgi:hypothetical protein
LGYLLPPGILQGSLLFMRLAAQDANTLLLIAR